MNDVTRKMAMAVGLAAVALSGAYLAGQTAPAAGQGSDRAALLASEHDNLDLQQVPAFRAFDNLYYVGVGWVGAWLVTTADGLILIDALDRPAHTDHLLDGVRRMGFDPRNIRLRDRHPRPSGSLRWGREDSARVRCASRHECSRLADCRGAVG